MSTSHTETTHALPTGKWLLDAAATTVTVTATKLLFLKVPATLEVTAGTIDIDPNGIVTNVEIMASSGSYTSGNPKRNSHVHSGDFLDADNHPELVFRASAVKPAGDAYEADGSVTVKGNEFPLTVQISNVRFDAGTGSFDASATVDRNAVGVDKLPSLIIARNLELAVAAKARVADS